MTGAWAAAVSARWVGWQHNLLHAFSAAALGLVAALGQNAHSQHHTVATPHRCRCCCRSTRRCGTACSLWLSRSCQSQGRGGRWGGGAPAMCSAVMHCTALCCAALRCAVTCSHIPCNSRRGQPAANRSPPRVGVNSQRQACTCLAAGHGRLSARDCHFEGLQGRQHRAVCGELHSWRGWRMPQCAPTPSGAASPVLPGLLHLHQNSFSRHMV